MNDAQRAAIQRHLKLLADDIMLTEELLGIMYQRRLFEKHMIETIKAEKTNTDKLYVMLHMLPKRGPDAFDNFIEILKPNYPWLASTLETTYRDEMTLVKQNSIISMCTACGGNGGLTARSDTQVDGGRQQPEIQVDADVKKKVECFIHKTFGHRKTIAHQDKRCMERWLSEQIQTERKQRMTKPSNVSEESKTPEPPVGSSLVSYADQNHEELKRVYNKVREENLCDNINIDNSYKKQHTDSNENMSIESGSDDVDDGVNANIDTNIADIGMFAELLGEEVDRMINKLNTLEGIITQCHYILGDSERKKKLTELLKEAQYDRKHNTQELAKEKAKSEEMLKELYDYSKTINKYELTKQQQRQEIDKLKEEVHKLERKNAVLTDRCETLEAANRQHIEKEKTLANLNKMIDDLKATQSASNDDNNLNHSPISMSRYRRMPRATHRKGSTADLSNPVTSRKVPPKTMNATRKRTYLPISRFP